LESSKAVSRGGAATDLGCVPHIARKEAIAAGVLELLAAVIARASVGDLDESGGCFQECCDCCGHRWGVRDGEAGTVFGSIFRPFGGGPRAFAPFPMQDFLGPGIKLTRGVGAVEVLEGAAFALLAAYCC